jgi:hypothetical protein
MVPGKGDNPNDSKGSGRSHGNRHNGMDVRAELTKDHNANGYPHQGIDHREARDYKVRRTSGVGALDKP